MTDNTTDSKASAGAKFRRRYTRTPRTQADNQGRPTNHITYSYDDDGLLVEAHKTDE